MEGLLLGGGVPGPGGSAAGEGWYLNMHWGRTLPPPPGETVTAADGTHPTEMHSLLMKLFAVALIACVYRINPKIAKKSNYGWIEQVKYFIFA